MIVGKSIIWRHFLSPQPPDNHPSHWGSNSHKSTTHGYVVSCACHGHDPLWSSQPFVRTIIPRLWQRRPRERKQNCAVLGATKCWGWDPHPGFLFQILCSFPRGGIWPAIMNMRPQKHIFPKGFKSAFFWFLSCTCHVCFHCSDYYILEWIDG